MIEDAPHGERNALLRDRIDALCDRFEAQWLSGGRPDLRTFCGELSPADRAEGQLLLLRQLIAVDLWYRWRRAGLDETTSVQVQGDTPKHIGLSEPDPALPVWPLLDDYVRCFPELGSPQALPDDLVAREYEVRCRRTDAPCHAEYTERFGPRPSLLELLCEVDAEHRAGSAADEFTPGGRQEPTRPAVVPTDGQFTLVPTAKADAGAAMFGNYEILEELGRGGMGVVFKAYQRKPSRIVALKMILSGQFAGEQEVQRFDAEVQAAAGLDHPHIVPLYEVGQIDGHHYYSMKFVDGPTLRKRLADGPLSASEAAALVEKVARAIAYANDRGVIHRDLKPANVLLDQHGNPRVSDFGLAKQLDVVGGLSATGQVVGTASYMPPEQAAGRKDQIGPHLDVYSLGAVLYESLTGRPPFQGANVYETLAAVASQEPVPPRALNRAIPRDLETICLKCLQKAAGQRYRSAHELADDLRRFLNAEPIRARAVAPAEIAWRWCRRKPVAAGLIAMSLIACFATGGLAFYRQRSVYHQQLLGAEEQRRGLSDELARRNEQLAAETQRLANLQQYFALLSQAREALAMRRPGWTVSALDNLAKAAPLRPADLDPAELRSLIAQCLAGFDLLTDQALTVAEGFDVEALAFSPDGRYLAVGQLKSDYAPAVFVYEVETRRKAFEFRFTHWSVSVRRWLQGDRRWQDGVWSLAFSGDSKYLAAGTRFGRVRCWQLGVPEASREYTVFEDTETVHGLAFSPDNRRLFASSPTAVKCVLLDAGSGGGKPLELGRSGRGRFAAGVRWLVTFGEDGPEVRDVLKPETPLPLRLPPCIEPVFSPDGERLAAVETRNDENGRVAIYDAATGVRVRRLAETYGGPANQTRPDPLLTFSPDGSLVFGHDDEGHVYAWDAASGQLLQTALLDEFRMGRYAVDPRGRYLAFGGRGKASLVPVSRRSVVREVAWQTSAIGSVDLSGDGRSVLCATAQPLRPEFPLTKRVLFSRHALSGADAAETTAAFLPFPVLPGNMPYAASGDLAAAPDGALAALAVPPAGVYLWDAETGHVASSVVSGSTASTCQYLEEDRLEIRGDRGRVSVAEDAAAVNGRALRIAAGPGRCEVHARCTLFADATADGDWAFVAVAKLRGGTPGSEWIETGSARPDATSRRAVPDAMIPRDAYHLFVLGWNRPADIEESQFLAVLDGGGEGAEVWIDRVIAVPVGKMDQYKWKDAFGPLAFGRDGSRLSGLVTTRRLHHWRMPDLALASVWDNSLAAAQSGNGYVQALDAGTDLALAGGRDGIVRAVLGDKLASVWPEQSAAIVAVRLSADESWAVVGTQQGGCGIARVPHGEPIAELPGHRGAVRAIALSPDDRWLATGDEEGTLRLWQRAGETFSLWLAMPFAGPIQAVRITPGRKELVLLIQGETAVRVLEWAELEDRLRRMGLGSG